MSFRILLPASAEATAFRSICRGLSSEKVPMIARFSVTMAMLPIKQLPDNVESAERMVTFIPFFFSASQYFMCWNRARL